MVAGDKIEQMVWWEDVGTKHRLKRGITGSEGKLRIAWLIIKLTEIFPLRKPAFPFGVSPDLQFQDTAYFHRLPSLVRGVRRLHTWQHSKKCAAHANALENSLWLVFV